MVKNLQALSVIFMDSYLIDSLKNKHQVSSFKNYETLTLTLLKFCALRLRFKLYPFPLFDHFTEYLRNARRQCVMVAERSGGATVGGW